MPGARRGHRGGKRSRGAAASEDPAPAQAGRKTASYAKLIAHMHHAPSHEAGSAVAEEEDADVVAPAPTGVADDDEAAGELDVEEEAEGEESGDEEEASDERGTRMNMEYDGVLTPRLTKHLTHLASLVAQV